MLNTGNADLDVKFFSLSCSHLKNYGSNKCIGDAMLVFLINSILENKRFLHIYKWDLGIKELISLSRASLLPLHIYLSMYLTIYPAL